MLKFKIMLIVLVALVYYGVTYCMLSRDICQYYADYYLFDARSFSIKQELAFKQTPIKKITDFFHVYRFNVHERNLRVIGFARYEENGLWTDGNTSKLSFLLPSAYSDVLLCFNIDPYVNARNPEIYTEVYLEDRQIAKWDFIYGKKMPKTIIKLAKKEIPSDRQINLTFKIEGMNSPQKLGYGDDTRKLGLSFNSIEVRLKN